jgi:hypothetical protein
MGERVELLRVRYPQSEQEEDELEERPTERLTVNNINRLSADEQFALSCEASGNPPPQVDWLLNGEPLLASSGRRSGSTFSVHAQRLYVQPHDPLTVAGTYTCVARNAIGVRSSSGAFTVQYDRSNRASSSSSTQPNPIVPQLKRLSEPQRAPLNGSLRLYCEFGLDANGGESSASSQWIAPSDDRPLRPDARRRLLSNGTLSIRSLQPSDEGYFRCSPLNHHHLMTFAVRLQISSKLIHI